MVTSTEIIEITGISRATLNNYIALGILPKPEILPPPPGQGRARRVGHFPDSAVDIIEKVDQMKSQGKAMAQIVEALSDDMTGSTSTMNKNAPPSSLIQKHNGQHLRLTLEHIEYPAYLVNPKFQVEWCNDAAQRDVFGVEAELSNDITERGVFPMLVGNGMVKTAAEGERLLMFHMSIAKNRMSSASLLAFGQPIDQADADLLAEMYHKVGALPNDGTVQEIEVDLAVNGEAPRPYRVHASFFREGIFFTYLPPQDNGDTLMDFLARRDLVIRDLLRHRSPYLTPVAVLVADLQDSVKICAELPPEEYFELINQIWGAMEPVLRRYYATHGKHVGDGMLYYFLPQPDSNHANNALCCAHDMREAMRTVSREWKKRKNWLNDLQLNIGIDEGREWFGTYQTPTHLEFTVLGDTVNQAARLSDFAREGTIWVTKNLIGNLTMTEREKLHYGIRRTTPEGDDVLVNASFARIGGLLDVADPKNGKMRDISMLPVTEVFDISME
ncbi:MAG: adenylate/guanylate cyclase domain-containing protein [Rhodospirillales bacterium]|nr:adenylate/guanylate cyclase domain-containing protein [Rhodospirillales bacterium]MCW8862733.1 adenylate/guanylate cyclase domain-containing protein [Rhodospirillales bacterium]